ncbi:FecR family protein [Marinifilum fragile]|uniref:FecR family protein n=1 Tax=Marinifilum fragile TaxID=570161 RepID=UPI0006CF25FF|nr:FecR family protein [Marinifilum fragile]
MTKEELQNYFYNQCTSQQAHEVQQWLSTIEAESQDEALLREILNEINVDKDDRLVNQAFEKFKKSIHLDDKNKVEKTPIVRRIGEWYRIAAAVLLIPILLTSLYFYKETTNPKEWVEEYVPYGQSKMVCLPDSSKLWLNAGTKLIYPKKFNNSLRQVYVAGEAYAQVTKDKSRPFVLSAGEVTVEVLGTKFNVKSYSEDSYIAVSLMEGSVKMNAFYKGESKTKLLKPGEIVRYSKSTGELQKSDFVIATRKQWFNSKGFYFMDESLSEIVVALERYFDVRINIENELLKKERFYSMFVNNESLDEILSALNASGKMIIERKNNMIYIR